jgi:hypothetical protein
MGIKVVIEFQAKPGERSKLKSTLEEISATHAWQRRGSWAAWCTSPSTPRTAWSRSLTGGPPRPRHQRWSRPCPQASMHPCSIWRQLR